MIKKRFYVIEYYEQYKDGLTWYSNLDKKHIECFDKEDVFITRLRKLEVYDTTRTKETTYYIGNISIWTGDMVLEMY